MRDIIDCAFWVWLLKNQHQKTQRPQWFANLSQSVLTQPWSANIPCMAQGTLIYDFYRDSILDTKEHYRVMDFPTNIDFEHISDGRSLIGESVDLSSLGSILYAVFFESPRAMVALIVAAAAAAATATVAAGVAEAVVAAAVVSVLHVCCFRFVLFSSFVVPWSV